MKSKLLKRNEKKAKNSHRKNIFVIMIILFIILIIWLVNFISSINSEKKANQKITEYLHSRYDKYSDYAKITDIKLVSKDYKLEVSYFNTFKWKNFFVREYIYEYTAKFNNNNSETFLVTLWDYKLYKEIKIKEINAKTGKNEKYEGLSRAFFRYDNTSLWNKLCPLLIKKIVDDTIGIIENIPNEYQVSVSFEDNVFGGRESCYITIPIDAKQFYKGENISIFNKLFYNIYKLDNEGTTRFYIHFNDLKFDLSKIYSY